MHHGIDTPATAQGQEVEVVEMGSNIGDAWEEGRRNPTTSGALHSLSNNRNLNLHVYNTDKSLCKEFHIL